MAATPERWPPRFPRQPLVENSVASGKSAHGPSVDRVAEFLGEGSPVTAMTCGRAGTVLKIPSARNASAAVEEWSAHIRGIHVAAGERAGPGCSPRHQSRSSAGATQVGRGFRRACSNRVGRRPCCGYRGHTAIPVRAVPTTSSSTRLGQLIGRRRAGVRTPPGRLSRHGRGRPAAPGDPRPRPATGLLTFAPAVSTHSFAHGMRYSGFFTERQAGPKLFSRANRGQESTSFLCDRRFHATRGGCPDPRVVT